MVNKKLIFVLLTFFGLISLFTPLSALAGFGASPATLFKENIAPGSSFSQEIVVSRSNPDEDVYVILETDLGQMADWFTFTSTQKVVFPKGENRLSIPFDVQVPLNTAQKSYTGAIRIKSVSIQEQDGVSVAQGARVDVNYIVSSSPIKELEVKSIELEPKSENQPIVAKITAINTGNVDAWPTKVTLDIYDLKDVLVKSLETTDLSVNINQDQLDIDAKLALPQDLPSGDYIAYTKVYMGSKLLRAEKLLLKILGASTVMAQEPSAVSYSETTYTQYQPLTLKEIVFFILFFIILLLINILILYFLKKRCHESRYKLCVIIVILELFIVSIVSFNLYMKNRQLDAYYPQVKSMTDSLIPTAMPAQNSNLTVQSTSQHNEYNIYQKADAKSQILIKAQEGDNFQVVEETPDWYRINLPSGQTGWLSKKDVISRQ